MECIITWAKENFDLISLGVGVIGVLVGIISVIQAKRTVAKANEGKKKGKEKKYNSTVGNVAKDM